MDRWKSDLILLFVAAVWGSGFVAQRLAAASVSPFYFNGARFLIAALLIFLVVRARSASAPRVANQQPSPVSARWMVLAGALLFAAAGLQQAGLATTTIGNASFITGLYVVIVPLVLFIFLKRRISWLSWLAVLIAVAGVMLLSLQGSFRLAPGDVLELIGAVLWALHVILVGRLAEQGADVLVFSVIQFATCGALNMGVALALDPLGVRELVASWQVVLYSALFPIALGFSLQIAGQKHAPAVDAAIILSMEAVFGTLFGFLFLGELLGPRQILGSSLLLLAMIIAQVRPVKGMELETA